MSLGSINETLLEKQTRENLQRLFLFDENLQPTVFIQKKINLLWLDKKNDYAPTPEKYQEPISTWKLYNPEYEIKIWNMADIKQLFKDHWNEIGRFYDLVFYKINWETSFISVCDVCRLLVLYVCGNLYSDLDITCLRNLDLLIQGRTVILCNDDWGNHKELIDIVTNSSFDMIDNCFMGFSKKLPFVYELLVFIQHRYEMNETSASFMDVFALTGPLCIAKFAQRHYIYGDYQTLPKVYIDICLTNKYYSCSTSGPFVSVNNSQGTFWYLQPKSIKATSLSLIKAWHFTLLLLFLIGLIILGVFYRQMKAKHDMCNSSANKKHIKVGRVGLQQPF